MKHEIVYLEMATEPFTGSGGWKFNRHKRTVQVWNQGLKNHFSGLYDSGEKEWIGPHWNTPSKVRSNNIKEVFAIQYIKVMDKSRAHKLNKLDKSYRLYKKLLNTFKD